MAWLLWAAPFVSTKQLTCLLIKGTFKHGDVIKTCDGSQRDAISCKVGALGTGLVAGRFAAGCPRLDELRQDATMRRPPSSSIWPGGPSHMDTFDLKPDAPEGIPRHVQSRLKPTLPGVEISEHLPKLASVRRQVRDRSRRDAHAWPLTGWVPSTSTRATARWPRSQYPAYGSVVAKRDREKAQSDRPAVRTWRFPIPTSAARFPRH